MHVQVYARLTKIDEEKRLIYARAADETPDKAKEVMDYATSKPRFEAWSGHISDLTGGLSKGNLRAMHDPKHSAGKLVDMAFDDAGQAIDICAKVVDDQDWKKCLEGVYTGVSIGGKYLRKWKDPKSGLTRYTADPSEISLVDNPCNPNARFIDLQKADGSVGQIELRGRARSFNEVLAKATGPRSFNEVLAGQQLAKRWGYR